MANTIILDPDVGVTKTISVTIEASIIVQDLAGDMEFFVALSTLAKDVMGKAITTRNIKSLSDGAGGTGLDRHGQALVDGKYANLTTAINDYIAVMVEGIEDEPWTEMAFT